MHRVGSLLQFIGGGIGRVALSGLLIGIFFLIVGVLPWEFFVEVLRAPPRAWYSRVLALLGLALIAGSLWFNLWSRKQQAIDALAEDISWAIQNLVNRDPCPST